MGNILTIMRADNSYNKREYYHQLLWFTTFLGCFWVIGITSANAQNGQDKEHTRTLSIEEILMREDPNKAKTFVVVSNLKSLSTCTMNQTTPTCSVFKIKRCFT